MRRGGSFFVLCAAAFFRGRIGLGIGTIPLAFVAFGERSLLAHFSTSMSIYFTTSGTSRNCGGRDLRVRSAVSSATLWCRVFSLFHKLLICRPYLAPSEPTVSSADRIIVNFCDVQTLLPLQCYRLRAESWCHCFCGWTA